MLTIELLDSIEHWDRLAGEWDALAAADPHDSPFRRFAWQRGWWTHYGGDRSLLILTARDDGRLVGLAPLCVEVESMPFDVRTIRFLAGTDVCSEYLGLLIEPGHDDEVVPALLDFLLDDLAGRWDVIRWSDIPADSPQVAAVGRHLQERDLFHLRRAGTSNLIAQLPAAWDEYLGGLSTSKRTKLRRIRKEFTSRETDIEIVQQSSQFDRCWDELRVLHARHWQERGEAGCFADPRFDAFHSALARDYLSREMLVLATLRLEGEAVAACYGFRLGDSVYEYQRGHDPAHIRLQPGHALQFALFEHAIPLGVRRWDYLRGDYRHKRDWSTMCRDCVDLTIPAPRRAQRARFCLERTYLSARRRLGRLRRQFQGWLRTSPASNRA